MSAGFDRKPGVWRDGIGYSYKCAVQGCEQPSAGYYDLSVTGIGDFLFHCSDKEHEAAVFAEGERIDEERRKDYQERKEWSENYTQLNALGPHTTRRGPA